MKKGDIVLIPFPFTNLSSNKTRPALVLIADDFDITVAFITSRVIKQSLDDVQLFPSVENGLKVSSVIKLNKIATIDSSLLLGRLGTLSEAEVSEVNNKLKVVFQL